MVPIMTWWGKKELWNCKNRQHISGCQTPRAQRGHREHFWSDGNILYCEYKGGYMTVIFVKIHIMEHKRLILSLINYNATSLTSKEKKKIAIRKRRSQDKHHCSLDSGKNGECVPSQVYLNCYERKTYLIQKTIKKYIETWASLVVQR